MKAFSRLSLLFPLLAGLALAQTDARQLKPILNEEILAPQVPVFQLRQYIVERVAKPPAPKSAAQWSAEASKLREQLLKEVVFHGWPQEWVNAPPKFEEVGTLPGKGYRIRKMRYEIVPGFQCIALLYEPDNLRGKVPAVLNVHGHEYTLGQTAEYLQKRSITMAKNGILTLSLDWLGTGQLNVPGNDHWFGAHMDLAGTNELGLFYLAMRKGLDYLSNHPNTDRTRIGMTGLSGGGWQTIVLSALDERVRVAIPVAGYSSVGTRVEANDYGDIGDTEQSATDFLVGRDFTHLTAMLAPRPALLIFNAEDDCCFRAGMVKPLVYDAIQPIFALYGKQDAFAWHENRDPGTHNYQLDNRTQAYHFFAKHFAIPQFDEDASVAFEIYSPEELYIPLPEDNLTILDLARKLASQVQRKPLAADAAGQQAEREALQSTIRLTSAKLERARATAISKHLGVESKSYLFQMSDGLSATGIWFRAIGVADTAPVSILLNDKNKEESAQAAADRINRGEQVLVLDTSFVGSTMKHDLTIDYLQELFAVGGRPLGIETRQLLEITRWAKERANVAKVRVQTSGMRTQLVSLVAAAIAPDAFSEVTNDKAIRSLSYAFEKPVRYFDAPEFFCLDLFPLTDIDRLTKLAAPVVVKNTPEQEAISRGLP
ncbi:MAG: acetylxylan esterase [Acidobacteria bacterium]|nr:acetylxylan esterase [Acidobacteriota bacterium]